MGAYLKFERICVVGTGGEVRVNSSASTEGSAVRQLILFPVLRLHTLSVAVGGVGGAHSLTAYTKHSNDRMGLSVFKIDS